MSALIHGVAKKWTWSINDVLVFSTLAVFFFVVCACSLTLTTRPTVKKDDINATLTADRQRSSWAANQYSSKGGSGKSKYSTGSSKSKDKKKQKKLHDLEGGSSESSSLPNEGESLLGGQIFGMFDESLKNKAY